MKVGSSVLDRKHFDMDPDPPNLDPAQNFNSPL